MGSNNALFTTVLTIAGSDSGGGAGIQADLKTFAFHCVHGASALTCLTAQNTTQVIQVEPVAPAFLQAQIHAVVDDLSVQAIKTGMLYSAELMGVVVESLAPLSNIPLVVDPVMVTRTGVSLMDQSAIATMRDNVLPLASIATPNRYEATLLSGIEIVDEATVVKAAQIIQKQGPSSVLIKGGGFKGALQAVDYWFNPQTGGQWLTTEMVNTPNTHGTGCTLSAAIAANLALGQTPLNAVREAKTYVTDALKHGLIVGRGPGPVGHFYPLL
ncbi:MAG: bifunctional hydroxymethylpyrimidine kinase/phosphomethylpyrimidine kinase [Cyanobacteria bacterium P01_H01_bin.15]